MQLILSIALGGAVGAVARHVLAHRIALVFGHGSVMGIPVGILSVNIIGSFLMGMLVTGLALRFQLPEEARAFLAVGVLGGFTTFSTFSLEAALLIEKSQFGAAALYVGGSVFLSIAGLFAGIWLARSLFGVMA